MDKLYKAIAAFFGGAPTTAFVTLVMAWLFPDRVQIDALEAAVAGIVVGLIAAIITFAGAPNTSSPQSLAQQVNRDTPAAERLRAAVRYQADVMKTHGRPASKAATTVATSAPALLLALLLAGSLSACSAVGGGTHEPPIATQEQTNTTAAASPNDLLAVAEVTFRNVVVGLRAARDAGLIERGGSTEAAITRYINDGNAALKASSEALTEGDLEGWAEWYGLAQGALGFLQARLVEAG